ncbi:MAG: 3-methyl-2-oxobutanoate hydroxymethyltransferase [Paracoccaceae bacterium]|nr:3-methyl-2-oxobutanoate hydroxymethyltransferase [Paracoccaceae bacterium]
MKKTFSFAGAPVERVLTVKCLRDAKGKRKFTQTTATTEEEARAASEAGIEMLIGGAPVLGAMRAGAPQAFITAGVHIWSFPSKDEILAQAFKLLEAGADAIYCPREPRIVEHLAEAKVPVMGHLGLVPRMATWTGGVRAIGRTADEAVRLFHDFKDLENAGALMVEAEVIAAEVLAEIAQRTSLTVVSLGSGPGGDVDYLFQEDICGETPTRPRHARAFGDLAALREQMNAARVAALAAFRESVNDGSFPAAAETVSTDLQELADFLERIS